MFNESSVNNSSEFSANKKYCSGGVDDGVGVNVGVIDGVNVGEYDGVTDGVEVYVGVGVGDTFVGVTECVGVTVGVFVGAGVLVTVGVTGGVVDGVGVTVGVTDAVGVGVGEGNGYSTIGASKSPKYTFLHFSGVVNKLIYLILLICVNCVFSLSFH